MKLTDDDKMMLDYFITEKGDVTRWSQWVDVEPLVRKELPELIDALERLEIARRTLDAVVKATLR